MLTSTLISDEPARGRRKLTFQHEAEDGTVYGPFVEHRPIDDDVTAFLAAHAVSTETAQIPAPAPTPLEQVVGLIRVLSNDAPAEALMAQLGLTEQQQALVWPTEGV